MAHRGPKPKPTVLRILEGNPGRRPLPQNEPQPKVGLPRCPSSLSPDAKKLWQSLGKKLAGCGLVTETDGPAFELLITAYLEWHEAAAKVAQTGPVWLEKGDGKIPKFAYSPYWVLSQRAQTRLLAVLREFGMTPSSRSSIQKAEPMHDTQEVNPAARYFG